MSQINAGVRSGGGRVRVAAAAAGLGAAVAHQDRQGGGAMRRQLVGQPALRQQLRQHQRHGEYHVCICCSLALSAVDCTSPLVLAAHFTFNYSSAAAVQALLRNVRELPASILAQAAHTAVCRPLHAARAQMHQVRNCGNFFQKGLKIMDAHKYFLRIIWQHSSGGF